MGRPESPDLHFSTGWTEAIKFLGPRTTMFGVNSAAHALSRSAKTSPGAARNNAIPCPTSVSSNRMGGGVQRPKGGRLRRSKVPRRRAPPTKTARQAAARQIRGVHNGRARVRWDCAATIRLGSRAPDRRSQAMTREKTNGESTPPAITSFSPACSGASSPRK